MNCPIENKVFPFENDNVEEIHSKIETEEEIRDEQRKAEKYTTKFASAEVKVADDKQKSSKILWEKVVLYLKLLMVT